LRLHDKPIAHIVIMSIQPYREYYAERLGKGLEFQDFVTSLLFESGIAVVQYASRRYQFERGENSGGIEIKFDEKFAMTRNLYIECAEKSHPGNLQYIRSGIYRQDLSWLYAIGDYRAIYLFVTQHLRWLHQRQRFEERQTPTSRGFLLPESVARKYAARILRPAANDKEVICQCKQLRLS
jgi:hypothetical protein